MPARRSVNFDDPPVGSASRAEPERVPLGSRHLRANARLGGEAMNCRPGHIPLALLLALGASLGCTSWPCGISQTLVPTQPAGPGPGGELPPAQAAQLCLTAGEGLEKKGFTAEAIHQYENARQHDPQVRTVARHLAVLYDLQGDVTHAEPEYLRALQEQSGDAELLNDFGYFHYRHGNLEAAENWLRNAVTVNPNCACAWINLGQVLARKGRNEESYQAFAHVLRPAEAYSNLGVLLAKQGRTAEARSALQQAIALDPGLAQPRAFLNALPSTPNLLPSGITHSAAPAPKVTRPSSVSSRPATPTFPRPAPTPPPVPTAPPHSSIPTPTLASITPLPPHRPMATASHSVPSPSPVVPAAAGEGPIIVNGPIRPAPLPHSSLPSNTAALRPTSFGPPSPPAPPPPPPIAPRPASAADGPIILRTSASMVQPAGAHPPTVLRMPDSLSPLTLPLTPPSMPLIRKQGEVRASATPSTPQATLIDCEGELDPEIGPR